jgi:hypothetical protein
VARIQEHRPSSTLVGDCLAAPASFGLTAHWVVLRWLFWWKFLSLLVWTGHSCCHLCWCDGRKSTNMNSLQHVLLKHWQYPHGAKTRKQNQHKQCNY